MTDTNDRRAARAQHLRESAQARRRRAAMLAREVERELEQAERDERDAETTSQAHMGIAPTCGDPAGGREAGTEGIFQMKTYTYECIYAMNPCWLREPDGDARLQAACARLGGTFELADVLRAEWLSPADRVWVATRPGVLPDRALRLFATRTARRALDAERAAGREPDPRSWAAVAVAERYAVGAATGAELAAARVAAAGAADAADAAAADAAAADAAAADAAEAAAAAWAAAWAADAAWAAVAVAERYAVGAATGAELAAARVAAADAAWTAAAWAWAAAWVARCTERQQQVADLLDLLSHGCTTDRGTAAAAAQPLEIMEPTPGLEPGTC